MRLKWQVALMMKVALLQFNPIVGAVENNAARILQAAQQAHEQSAKMLVAPELALVGYPAKDLLYRSEILQQVENSLADLAAHAPLPILLGAPVRHYQPDKNPLWNAAVLCRNGKWQVVARKILLPNYDVFDEQRYFASWQPADGENSFVFNGVKIGVSICEDAWNDSQFWSQRRYQLDPVARLAKDDVDLLLNIAASPFSLDKPVLRERMLCHAAKLHQKTLLMVGQCGANDQLIFDGSSCLIDSKGNAVMRMSPFVQSLCVVDVPKEFTTPPADFVEPMALLVQALTVGIRDYVSKCGMSKVVVGLSGGIDSAVTAALAVKALGAKHVVGIRMPSAFSSEHSLKDAQDLANNLGILLITVPIESAVEMLRHTVAEPFAGLEGGNSDIADQNLQARVRCNILMDYANRTGALVLATGNKSELAVGYTTIYGDLAGALAPLGDVYKTQISQLALFINKNGVVIPTNTIIKPPSAELRPNQKDQDSLPAYAILDEILVRYIEQDMTVETIASELGISKDGVRQVTAMVQRSEYKRKQAPIVLMVSNRVFGDGRRWPVAQGSLL